ncbi:bifunctional metallophosphatase/5'-nucleotidase [Agarivorans sp. MS3-6]|uniref:bifunctional metallophosphatase/5'-nucleotidase n=1 Tax=Agarivorans sp. TSD2052 TaxID=2937286 RepID=UPI002010B2B1|nr:bifunctional metallophosphatase/5'-nucleotidase [Agarivorans sp. TSD2052]UPW17036.1 bifunctional metallophosphatase/5'-nucleotidase [Agarivorans sp. TSD2052]
MSYSLYLAHINDTHSHFESSLLHFKLKLADTEYQIDAHCGGYARIASAVKAQRQLAKQQGADSLLLHAGDSFQGSLYFSQFKGLANARLLNLLAPDALTIGNHEFDLGNAPVAQFIEQANFALLAGNMDLSQEDQNKAHPLAPHNNLYRFDNQRQIAQYLLKPLADKQLAIVGITHDQMHNIGCPDADCHFLNAIQTTRATIEHLHQQGINHILVLSHLGYHGDVELAKAVDGISVIVGGHSHTLTGDFSELGISSTEQAPQWVNDCLILQAGKHAESIGLEKLTFDHQGKVTGLTGGVSFLLADDWQAFANEQVVSNELRQQINDYVSRSHLFSHFPEDPQIKQIIDRDYRPVVEQMREQIITTLPTPLLHTRLPNHDYPLGSEVSPLVCKGFYQIANKHSPTDFALHNAGGVRVSLKAGPLTKAEICGRLLPFEIALVSYLIKGEDLASVIEGAIDNAYNNGIVGTGDGSFPYFYRLRYQYNGEQPQGQRVKNIKICQQGEWIAVKEQHAYRGVSSAYTLAGKEGYHALLNSWDHQDLATSMSDSFVEYASTLNALA